MRLLFIVLFITATLKGFSQDTISVVLSPYARGYKIPSDFVGLSFEKNSLNKAIFAPSKDTLIRLFQTLGIKSVRIGGNSVDKDTFSTTASATRFTRAELDSFYLFMQKADCKVLMGLNFGGDFNPALASDEVSYVMSKYASNIQGLEVGNEPDLYHSNGFRPSTYNVDSFEKQYSEYYDAILLHTPSAVFTGPASAGNYTTFTLPFCRDMHGKFTMLTQHYYVAKAYSLPTGEQIANLLNSTYKTGLLTELNALVECADSAKVPFRMAECNSLYNGGQLGVSDAFASALWALDYMYASAYKGCEGVNFHGGVSGAYTPLSYKNFLYSLRPIGYGILAFQAGSKGWFIPSNVSGNHINLSIYNTIDSLKNIYTTIVNKDTSEDALIKLDAGSNSYLTASYISLTAPFLADTINVSIGGQKVTSYGTCQPYNWQDLNVSANKIQLLVPKGSATMIHFREDSLSGINQKRTSIATNDNVQVYPNPSTDKFTIALQMPAINISIEIYNSTGQKIKNITFNNISKLDINTSEFNKGIYYVRVISEATTSTAKVIIE